jgi:hypothetical protein
VYRHNMWIMRAAPEGVKKRTPNAASRLALRHAVVYSSPARCLGKTGGRDRPLQPGSGAGDGVHQNEQARIGGLSETA